MGGSLGKSDSENKMVNSSTSNALSNSASGSSSNYGSSALGSAIGGNQSQFGQNVWDPQGQALGGYYGQLGGALGNTIGNMQAQAPGAVSQQMGVFDQATPAWQQQLGGGAYQGMNLQDQYNRALSGGGNEQFIDQSIMGGAGNNYADAMKQQLQSDAFGRLGRGLSTLDQRAAGGGMSGSSRHGIAQARMFEDEQDRLANQQTNIGFNTFDKDLDRKLGIAQRADQFDMGRLNNISGMLGAQNQAMQGGLNFGQGMQNLGMGQFNPYMAPLNAATGAAGAFGAPTVLGSGQGSAYSSALNQANANSNANTFSNANMQSNATGYGRGSGDSKGFGLGLGK